MAEKISITIEADEKFAGAFQKLVTHLGSTEAATSRATSAFSKFQATIITVNQGLDLLNRVTGIDLAGTLRRLPAQIIETSDRFLRMDIMLRRVEGSVEAAGRAKQRLIAITKEMPIALDVATAAFVKFETLGFKNSERAVRALANATAAFGGTQEELKRAIIAVQQIMGKGVVSMEELRQQLGEAIPASAKIAARELGMTLPQMFDLIAKGSIDSKVFLDALIRGFEKDFGGAGAALMETWSGATTRMQTAWDLLLVSIGNTGILSAAVSGIKEMTRAIETLTKTVDEFQHGTWDLFGTNIAKLTREQLPDFIDSLERAMEASSAMGGAGSSGMAVLTARYEEAWDLLNKLNQALEENAKKEEAAAKAAEALTKPLEMMPTLLPEIVDRMEEFEASGGKVARVLLSMTDEFEEMRDALKQLTVTWLPDLEEGLGILEVRVVNVADAMGFLAGQIDPVLLKFRNATSYIDDLADKTPGAAEAIGELFGLGAQDPPMLKQLREIAKEIDRIVKSTGQFMGSPTGPPSGAGGGAQGSDWFTGGGQGMNAFAGVGNQMAGQIAGVQGALTGMQAGGPMGALAGFFTELLLKNEKMQELLGAISDILVEFMTPIAEAIAPTVEAMLPLLEALQPAFETLGALIELYLKPSLAVLKLIAKLVAAINPGGGSHNIWDVANWSAGGQSLADTLGFQHGGPIGAGQLAMVGEHGPELFMPRVPGRIMPSGGFGGMTVVLAHPDANALFERFRQWMEMQRFRGR